MATVLGTRLGTPDTQAGGGAGTRVADIASLATLAVSAGSAYVESVRDVYVYRAASTATADGITVLAAAGGVGRWERLSLGHPSWNAQADWGIHPTTGSDEAVGTAAAPLKTSAELQRRIGVWGTLPPVTNLQVQADLPVLQSFRLFATLSEGDGTVGEARALSITGARSQVITGTLTGYTALSRVGAGSRNTITTGTAINWALYVDKMIRLTSGTGTGYFAWVQAGGVDTATLTPWVLESATDLPAGPPLTPLLQPVGIVAGNTFEVLSVTSLGGDPQIRLQGAGYQASSIRGQVGIVALRWVRNSQHTEVATTTPIALIEGSTSTRIVMHGCDLQVMHAGANFFVQGSLIGAGGITCGTIGTTGLQVIAGGHRMRTAVGLGMLIATGSVSLDGDFCVNYPLIVGVVAATGPAAGGLKLANVSFNVTGDAIQVGKASTAEVAVGSYATAVVYGSATAYGVRCASGGTFYYSTKPTINAALGAGRETIVGGTDTVWASIPFANATNLSCIAASA